MKILFAPSDLGGGRGHVSRCTALAAFAEKAGHSSVFLLQNSTIAKELKKRYAVAQIPDIGSTSSWLKDQIHSIMHRMHKDPLFVKISGLSYQVLRDGLLTTDIINKRISEFIEVIHNEKPDLIVGDTNLLIGTAARLTHIPVVQLVRKGFHPNDPNLIWWQPSGPEIEPPAVTEMFNIILQKRALPPVSKIESMLNGDLILIPSLPELEPLRDTKDTSYIGPLLTEPEHPVDLYEFENDETPLIYITIGGGAGTVGSRQFFKTIVSAFANRNLQVIVSTTPRFYRKSLNRYAKNVRFEPWVSGRALINQADLIVFHGGYGTMMESIDAGKPSLVIPFHSEQESNGRRLKDLGCAELIHLSRQEETLVCREWNQSDYSYACQWNYDLGAEDLFSATDTILSNRSYKKAAQILQKKSRKYSGSQLFFDIVNSRLGVK